MAYDILNTVVDKLITLLTADLQTAIATSDPLRLQTIDRAPLQEDRVLAAPFLIVGFDVQKGRVMDPLHEMDLGGGIRWLNHFIIAVQIAQVTTKENAYTDVAKLNDRVLRTLFKHFNLDGLTADNGEVVIGAQIGVVDQNSLRVFGGESEWFGEIRVNLHYFSEETYAMRT